MEYLIETENIGGIIISSLDWFNSFSEELSYYLDVVLDVDGRTELAADYPKQNWKQIWLTLSNSVTLEYCVCCFYKKENTH